MLAIALIAASAAPLQSQASTAKWQVIADGAVCYLMPVNRDADEQPFMVEEKPLAQSLDLVLAGKKLPKGEAPATVSDPSRGSPIEATYYPAAKSGIQKQAVRIEIAVFARLAAANALEIRVADKPPIKLATEGMAIGFAALRQCTSAILTRIGYVPDEPTPPPPGGYVDKPDGNWITNEDFASIRARGSGKATIGWIVGRDGRVRNCTTLSSEGNEAIGPQSCKILTKRAKFKPITDPTGAPVEEFKHRQMIFIP